MESVRIELMHTLCILTVAVMKIVTNGEKSQQGGEGRGQMEQAEVQNKSEQVTGE